MQVLQILRLTGVEEIEIKGRHARLSFLLQIGGRIEGATSVGSVGKEILPPLCHSNELAREPLFLLLCLSS
jgi:hypothetical protein